METLIDDNKCFEKLLWRWPLFFLAKHSNKVIVALGEKLKNYIQVESDLWNEINKSWRENIFKAFLKYFVFLEYLALLEYQPC